VDSAHPDGVLRVLENVRKIRPEAMVLEAVSPVLADDPSVLRGRRVLAIDDGPTMTHGGMSEGAGVLGARKSGAAEVVDPRPFAEGELADTLRSYPHLTTVLPAMGYGQAQIRDLERTIRRAVEKGGVEAVSVGTPIDLARLLEIPVPHTRIRYELQVIGRPTLEEALAGIPT